jgi:hypothetical protein
LCSMLYFHLNVKINPNWQRSVSIVVCTAAKALSNTHKIPTLFVRDKQESMLLSFREIYTKGTQQTEKQERDLRWKINRIWKEVLSIFHSRSFDNKAIQRRWSFVVCLRVYFSVDTLADAKEWQTWLHWQKRSILFLILWEPTYKKPRTSGEWHSRESKQRTWNFVPFTKKGSLYLSRRYRGSEWD